MVKGEETVKGIILSSFPQGEYGKRLTVLTDKYGKITVFAAGAAKQSSKLIGSVRPFTCGEFTILEGKNARNLHGIKVISSFDEISTDPETAFYGSYILEAAGWFAREGMTEQDSRNMLNLMYTALRALSAHELPAVLIRRIFELRLLVHEGTYTSEPSDVTEESLRQWLYVIRCPLSALFSGECWNKGSTESFIASAAHLFHQEVPHKFNSEIYL